MKDDTTAEGIPLRDYFAGQYMATAIGKASGVAEYEIRNMFGDRPGITYEQIGAALAYRYADAMIAARQRR